MVATARITIRVFVTFLDCKESNALYLGHDEPCASLFLTEVSRALAWPKKACSLVRVHLW